MAEPVAVDRSHMVAKFVSHEDQEMETLRYWRDRSVAEKMAYVTELAEYAYRMRGIDVHAERPRGPVTRVQR
jgi:hypothetical protein